MDVTVMLADWADSINGKLYIQGGGWSRVPAGLIHCALAIKVGVPWTEANAKHRLLIRLVDADGQAVVPAEGQPPVEIETMFEVGRPPGLVPGTTLDVALAPNFIGLPLPPGRYRFALELDGAPLNEGATFDVV